MEHSFEFQKGVPKYEIYNPNFDAYFNQQMDGIPDVAKAAIPFELSAKLFKGSKMTSWRLTFQEKMFILNAVLGHEVTVIISTGRDSNEAVSIDLLNDAIKAQKRAISALEVGENIYSKGLFVVANKELAEAVAFTRLICCGDVYRTLIPAAKRKAVGGSSRFEEHRAAYRGIVRLFTQYESGKRRIQTDFGMTIPEWYCLLHYFHGEKSGKSFYMHSFLNAQGVRKASMKMALTRLSREGYLLTRGRTQKRMYRLSPKGEVAMMEIFDKFIFK